MKAWGLAGLALLAGCGPESFPKGHGAGGQPLKVLAQGQDSFVRLYKLSPEQQKRFDVMHRKFEEVVAAAPNLAPADQARVDAVRAAWDSVPYATPGKNLRFYYQAIFDTDAGEMPITVFTSSAPDHIRSFVALARGGYFKGKTITFDGRSLRIAAGPAGKSAFTVPRQPCPALPVPPGALFVESVGDRDSGENFLLATEPILELGTKTTLVGVVMAVNGRELVEGMVRSAKAGRPPIIKSVEVTSSPRALFEDSGDVGLAKVDSAGKLVISDSAMFAQARSEEALRIAKAAAEKKPASKAPPETKADPAPKAEPAASKAAPASKSAFKAKPPEKK